MRTLLILTLLASAVPAARVMASTEPAGGDAAVADTASRSADASSADASSADAAPAAGQGNPYGAHSDEELTALAAHWESLDRHQRRALLTEMKLRMARKGNRSDDIHIRSERRYGRIIRQPDGQVIHIETQVIHVRPVNPDELEARQSYGVGFEQRIGRRRHELHGGTAEAGTADAPADADGETDGQPSLNGVLESLVPSTQAPPISRLPVYQVSDPKP